MTDEAQVGRHEPEGLDELLRLGAPAIVQTGKLTALGELAGGVAHEINNPLFAILGLVEFLLREVEEGTKAHQRLLLVQETGLEIKELVRAMLAFAREQSGERGTVSLDHVVADALALVRLTNAAKGFEIVERLHGQPLAVVASPNDLKQVVLHLVANARQAMPDGGTVTVGVSRGSEHATVTVADTGPGVPEASRSWIFEPFATTRDDGTGLGLAVARSIARAHGGDLDLETGGPGARFVLRLPLADR
ncbi:MAG: sensor histidine kinase [Pseudomonadota bacterium]